MNINQLQQNIIDGLMLGDGTLEIHGTNPRLSITRSTKDLDYLEWHFKSFKNLCKQGIVNKPRFDKRTNKYYERAYFRTRTLPIFLPLRNKWYKNNIKIIPSDLLLNPIIIATWILDDGHFEKMKNIKVLKMHLATNSFSKDEVYFLKSLLDNRYNCKFTISKCTDKEQYTIIGANTASRLLLREIDSYIPNNVMCRKTSIWRNPEVHLYDDNFLKL